MTRSWPAPTKYQLTHRATRFGTAQVNADPPPFTPLILQPGQTGTITVTITPNAPRGTIITGHLFIDDFNDAAETGDELRPIPYTYTVG